MKRPTDLPRLDPAEAFVHIAYDYRYLSLGRYVWERYGPAAPESSQRAVQDLARGLDVLVQDSVLLHARALIEFFTRNPSDADRTNITYHEFALPAATAYCRLRSYRDPISVHLLHLAAWRDPDYRDRYTRTGVQKIDEYAAARLRPGEWKDVIPDIFADLSSALEDAARTPGAWAVPFTRLSSACTALINNPQSFDWPDELGERENVLAYLKSVGVP
jgi:hypothetical protein